MLDQTGLVLVFVTFIAFSVRRLMTYLHIYQQEEYDSVRFAKWLFKTRAVDTRLTLALFLTSFLWRVLPSLTALLITASCFAVITAIEKDPRKASKKKLVMTARAKRIFYLALVLMIGSSLWWFVRPLPWFWIINVQAVPLAIVLGNLLLQPWEKFVQKKYWSEAHKKLKTLDPKVIGITGSFGKTSVKHILGHILKMQAPTLITPGSVNTPMGITRIIREKLDETHKYFVVEMGAYGHGSIERLCRLAPPDIGVITAIGQAHYERFKTLEAVAETKFELADAVLKDGSTMIVHENVLGLEHAAKIVNGNRARFVICGQNPQSDLIIRSVRQKPEGVEVMLVWMGTQYILTMPIYGLHHGHNAALAFAVAAMLGVPSDHIITALKSVPQITHRLEVKRQPDGSVIIDDAFNSNPQGFSAALQLLADLPGRKILITPGMVELGAAHAEEHYKIGRRAGEVCDIALVVMPDRVPTMIKGFEETGPRKTLIKVSSFTAASEWLGRNRTANDVVLLENDLPDLYESVPKI